ncbi:MAG: ATP-binding sensor histidine kinase [Pseudomonadota bacterium]|nr:ATP-binding sensor histidine kinase [Pseudomonadota bacterium]
MARFQHEYEMTQELHLKGAIKTYELKTYNNGIALIFEDVGGHSLKYIIAEHPLNLSTFIHFAIQLAEAIGELHQHHIIHKDIKPANIIINIENQEVKITDFSISARLFQEQPTGLFNPEQQFEGTLAYMSPEQTGRMNRTLDYRSDLYSLGVTFYEMLVGQLPFQTTDPMELVHCHIAKIPPTPHEENSEIPPVVSDIIMKLLAKNAEERYQTAQGLLQDLKKCQQALTLEGKIDSFRLAQHDMTDKFQLPPKLYGRDAESACLIEICSHVSQNQAGIVLISGDEGTGKTALVQDLKRPGVRPRGFFVQGQFIEPQGSGSAHLDDLNSNTPYSGIIQAFRELLLQLLTEPAAQMNVWQQQLTALLGSNSGFMTQVIPELEIIIGTPPPTTELTTLETQNLLNLLFEKLLTLFAQPEHPLILFLDDLQWADSASLKLLYTILSNPTIRAFLLIGNYRSNISLSQSFQDFLLLPQKNPHVPFKTIQLKPLKLEHVNQLIADTLRCTLTRTQGLAELIARKTEGNPFFVKEFLKTIHQHHALWFDSQQKQWHWDIKRILNTNMTDNVVALTSERLHQLAPATQEILKIAACIGRQFDIKTLTYLVQQPQHMITEALWEAIEENLINPQGDTYHLLYSSGLDTLSNYPFELNQGSYTFVHERIRQAAYNLLSPPQQHQLHFQLGQHLRDTTTPEQLRERLFDIVDHLNLSQTHMAKPAERHDLARLNLAAGKKAKNASAYEKALNYFQIGVALLSQDSWVRQYQLTVALHLQAMELAYFSSQDDYAEQLFKHLLQQAQSLLDQVRAYEQKIQFYITQNQPQKALDTGLYVLELLNVQLPQSTAHLNQLLTELQTRLGEHAIEQLLDLPPMKDAHKQAALRILVSISASAYIAAPSLYPRLCFTQVKLCIDYGNSAFAAHAYAAYSLLLCGVLGHTEMGYRLGLVALKILERYQAQTHAAKVLTLVNAGTRHWKEHAHHTLEPLETAIRSGLDSGDAEYACYAAVFAGIYRFFTGEKLPTLQQHYQYYLELMTKFNQEFQLLYAQLWQQIGLNLQTAVQRPCHLSSQHFNEDNVLPLLLKKNNTSALFSAYFAKALLCYLFKDIKQALTYAELADRYVGNDHTFIHYSIHNFYYSLTLLAQYPKVNVDKQNEYLKRVQKNQAQLLHWARHAPMNYQHKYDLVTAERARVLGKISQAMIAYERAIQGANRHEYLQEEALANELAAEFYTSLGIHKAAKMYLIDAYYAYLNWGAYAKTKALETQYPFLVRYGENRHHKRHASLDHLLTADAATSTHTILQQHDNFDLAAVMKAAQTISGEIVLEQLIKKLLHIVVENAGAQKGLLILEKDGQLFVEAEAYADPASRREEQVLLQSIALEALSQQSHNCLVSPAVVNYVVRTRSHIVLNEATREGLFTQDPYVLQCQPKSILGTPLLNKGHLIGVLYLENNLVSQAFTPERLKVLRLLSTQIAISIENALFYAKTEQTREAAEMASRAKSAFLMNMSHELRTPLNAILGYTDIIYEDAEDMGYDAILIDLEKIQTAGKQLLEIISNVLDISKIEADKMELHLEDFAVQDLIGDVVTVIEPSLGSNRLEVIQANDIGNIQADRTKIQQILLNLLSNAVKFTSKGQITLTVGRYVEENGSSGCQFEIKDSGIGMTPEQIEHVFEAFNQVDNSTTRQYGGTGLGLTISERFCRMMGGHIKVTSQPNQGATFSVYLPCQILPQE